MSEVAADSTFTALTGTDKRGTGLPLNGLRVVELAGIGPGPHACMLLGDLGAEVVRVEREQPPHIEGVAQQVDAVLRNRLIVVADLKNDATLHIVQDLIARADVVVEGFRPGVVERLGIGPVECMSRNPELIYARITGWGQDGPWARMAGHDINYLSVTGVLDNIGRPGGNPVPPLNLVGDYGGGSMLAVVGILAALVERSSSGRGQVVDAAMVDGVGILAQMLWSLRGNGLWSTGLGENLIDGSRPFYDTYKCADGGYVAVGALEPEFFSELVRILAIDSALVNRQWEKAAWPEMRRQISCAFLSRTRDDWMSDFDGTDACVTPVLTFDEALTHVHAVARNGFMTVGGIAQPSPAPRLSGSEPCRPRPALHLRDATELARVWL